MIDLVRGRPLVFETLLSREEVTARLRREIAAPKHQLFENRTNLFEGSFVDDRFRVVRLVRGRNSFRPLISGRVSSGTRGARIDVELQLHAGVVVLLAILLLAGGAAASIAIPEFLRTREPSVPIVFVLLMACAFSGFALISAVESRRAARMLAGLFETEPAGRETSAPRAPAT